MIFRCKKCVCGHLENGNHSENLQSLKDDSLLKCFTNMLFCLISCLYPDLNYLFKLLPHLYGPDYFPFYYYSFYYINGKACLMLTLTGMDT